MSVKQHEQAHLCEWRAVAEKYEALDALLLELKRESEVDLESVRYLSVGPHKGLTFEPRTDSVRRIHGDGELERAGAAVQIQDCDEEAVMTPALVRDESRLRRNHDLLPRDLACPAAQNGAEEARGPSLWHKLLQWGRSYAHRPQRSTGGD